MDLNTLLIPFIGALSNMLLRGGGLESWLFRYKNITGLRYVNSIIFGLCAYFVTKDTYFSISMTIAMTLGQLWKIPHEQAILGNCKPMTIRGMVWCLPMILTMLSFGYNPILYVMPFFLMYYTYRLPILYYETRKWDKYLNQVTVAELFYGFLLFLPLVINGN